MLATICLKFVLCQLLISHVNSVANSAMITLLDNTMRSFPAETTNFGYDLSDRFVYQAELMLPPGNDTQLCTFPSFLENQTETLFAVSRRIGIFVSLGGCDVSTKIKVALEIYKTISFQLRFVVFYNDDPNNQDEIIEIKAPSNISTTDLEELAFSVVSTSTGRDMMGRIEQHARISGSTPNFLGPGSDGWQLHMFLETFQADDVRFRTKSNDPLSRFFWYRVVLFCILVVSPLLRAFYLWWTGGGRIRFQRNEQGRIVGLVYTPPMPYWFVAHGTQEPEPVANKLTSGQVMALPEITYEPHPVAESGTNDSENNSSRNTPDESSSSGKADDKRLIKIIDRESMSFNSAHPLESSTSGAELTTTCTTCSICIEDYESGERIRLLPCGHAFHTECILPWLTNRQGCCPLCKVRVMGEEGEQQQNASVDDEESHSVIESSQVPNSLEGSQDSADVDIETPNLRFDNTETQHEEGR